MYGRLSRALEGFICNVLGVNSVSPPPFSFLSLSEDLSADEPVLFLVSPGADPCQELADFANQTVGADRYYEVAMGQGQSDIALTHLRKCAERGMTNP